jgi:hypothetical protein
LKSKTGEIIRLSENMIACVVGALEQHSAKYDFVDTFYEIARPGALQQHPSTWVPSSEILVDAKIKKTAERRLGIGRGAPAAPPPKRQQFAPPVQQNSFPPPPRFQQQAGGYRHGGGNFQGGNSGPPGPNFGGRPPFQHANRPPSNR